MAERVRRLSTSAAAMSAPIAIVAIALFCGQAAAQNVAGSCALAASRPAFSDAQLLHGFPDKATYDRRRDAALEPGRKATRASQEHLESLRRQRKEFAAGIDGYPDRPLPSALQGEIDKRDAAIASQEALLLEQRCYLGHLTERYDRALVRLGPLWAAGNP